MQVQCNVYGLWCHVLNQHPCSISVFPSASSEVLWSGCRFHVMSGIFLPMQVAVPHVLVFLPLGNNVTCTSPPVSASAGPSISPCSSYVQPCTSTIVSIGFSFVAVVFPPIVLVASRRLYGRCSSDGPPCLPLHTLISSWIGIRRS